MCQQSCGFILFFNGTKELLVIAARLLRIPGWSPGEISAGSQRLGKGLMRKKQAFENLSGYIQ